MPKPETNPDGSINWGNVNFNREERRAHEAHTPPPTPQRPAIGSGGEVQTSAPAAGRNYDGAPPGTVLPGGRLVQPGEVVVQDGNEIRIYNPATGNPNPSSRINIPMATGAAPSPGQPGYSPAAAMAAPAGGQGNREPSAYEKLLADAALAAARNEAAEITYRNAVLQGQRDDAARAAAQQAWQQKFSEQVQAFTQEQALKQFAFNQEQANRNFGLSEAGVTGLYGGQQTLQARAQQDQTGLGLLNLGASLRGPQSYLSYLRSFSGLSGGLKDAVNGLAGRFQLPRQQSANPNATYERASVAGMLSDINGPPAANDASGVALPAGSQWNPANVTALRANPTAWGLTGNLFDESGRDFNSEYAAYLSSLPRFTRQGAAVRL